MQHEMNKFGIQKMAFSGVLEAPWKPVCAEGLNRALRYCGRSIESCLMSVALCGSVIFCKSLISRVRAPHRRTTQAVTPAQCLLVQQYYRHHCRSSCSPFAALSLEQPPKQPPTWQTTSTTRSRSRYVTRHFIFSLSFFPRKERAT